MLVGEATELGRRLEHEVDTLVCLAASFYLVVSGILPWYFMAVGVARPLFLLGIWIREQTGRPVYELRHSKSGRILAGVVMNCMLLAMIPIVPVLVARIAMPVAALPFLAGFVRDFYGVCGGRTLELPELLRRRSWRGRR